MAMIDLDIVGTWPDFAGKPLEGLVVQESWFDGACDDEANVVWFLVAGEWHKLYFDGDAVFWSAKSRGPGAHQDEEVDDADFPLSDLGEKHALAGKIIAECVGDYVDEASEVTVRLAGGPAITFRNKFDCTTVVVADESAGT